MSRRFVFSEYKYGNGTTGGDIVAVGNGYNALSYDGTNWYEDITHMNGIGALYTAYGNGVYVSVGKNIIRISYDGVNWEGVPSATNNKGIIFADDIFLIWTNEYLSGTYYSTVLVSEDGINWTQTYFRSGSSDSFYITSVSYNFGVFAAHFLSINRQLSYDGYSWFYTPSSPGTGTSSYYVQQSANNTDVMTVGISFDRNMRYTYNMLDWYSGTGLSDDYNSIAYGNGVYVIVGDYASKYSTDGITFTLNTNLPNTNIYNGVAYGNGIFVTTSGRTAYISTDGITWDPYESPNIIGPPTFMNGEFFSAGLTYTSKSVDGVTWELEATLWNNYTDLTLGKDINDNDLYIAIGTNALMTSSNGITWEPKITEFYNNNKLIKYGSGIFIAIGDILTPVTLPYVNKPKKSIDGETWTNLTIPLLKYKALEYFNGSFIATGADINGKLNFVTSTDGITWTTYTTTQSFNTKTGIIYALGTYYISAGTIIYTSTDLITWVETTVVSTSFMTQISYGKDDLNIPIFVGLRYNTINYSYDGFAWTNSKTTSYYNEDITYNGEMFIVVTVFGILTSLDGKTWSTHTTTGKPTAVVSKPII